MAFNPYYVSFSSSAPDDQKDRIYCQIGKAPSIQIVADTFTSLSITDGISTQSIPYPIILDENNGLKVFSVLEMDFVLNIEPYNLYLTAVVNGITMYSPFISFKALDLLDRIEYSHHEPIVSAKGFFLSYKFGFKQVIYIPKRLRIPSFKPEDTTESKNSIDFDFHKILSRRHNIAYIGHIDQIEAISHIDLHSYVTLNGENMIDWEIGELKAEGDSIFSTDITFRDETTISSNIANGTAQTKWMEINHIQFTSYSDMDDDLPLLVSDVKARLLVSPQFTTINLVTVGGGNDILNVSQDSNATLTQHYIQDLTPLVAGEIYYYEFGGKRSPCFRLPHNNERLLKITVTHSGVIDNGGNPMFYDTVQELSAFFPIKERLLIPKLEPNDNILERESIEFKMYGTIKKTYSIDITTHPSCLPFLTFCNTNDSVIIEIDGVIYNTWDLQVSEAKYNTSQKITVTLTWFAGELIRSRNKAKALDVRGDYANADYSDDYYNL